MKWLVLLILISCGKHQEPKAVDLGDSDGDQRLNYQEGEFEKYVADFESLNHIRGVMKFSTDKVHEVSFSNLSNLSSEAMSLAVGNDSRIHEDQYFMEWSEIKMDVPKENISSLSSINTIHFYFEATNTRPDELILMTGKSVVSLGPWSSYMSIHFNQEQFNSLMSGKASLGLRKKFSKAPFFANDSESTIRQKTYKVIVRDENSARVLYVSSELAFDRLINYLKIPAASVLDDELLFFNSSMTGEREWYYRIAKNGDMVLINATIQELKENFRERFQKSRFEISRENGSSISSKVLAANGSKIYLIIRPKKSMRTFKEESKVVNHRSGSRSQGSDDSWNCTYYTRKIEHEFSVLPTFEEFLSGLGKGVVDYKLIQQMDEKGVFWEVMFSTTQELLHLQLSGRSDATYKTTGQYNVACERGLSAYSSTASYRTNEEAKLSFEIESFVEKTR